MVSSQVFYAWDDGKLDQLAKKLTGESAIVKLKYRISSMLLCTREKGNILATRGRFNCEINPTAQLYFIDEHYFNVYR